MSAARPVGPPRHLDRLTRVMPGTMRTRSWVTAAMLAAEAVGAPAPYRSWSSWAALILIVTAMTHGALDHVLIASARGTGRRRAVVGYVALMAATAALACLAPGIAAAVFVVAAIHHFGEAELRRASPDAGPVATLSRGTIYVAALCSHEMETRAALELVGLGWWSGASALALALVVAATVLQLYALRGLDHERRRRQTWRLVLLGALLVVARPLVGFAIYFALWHAADHCDEIRQRRPGGSSLIALGRAALPNVAITLAAATVVLVIGADHQAATSTLGPMLLVAIAAVTVPHAVAYHLFGQSRRATVAATPSPSTP